MTSQRAVLTRLAHGAGKELVPRRESRAFAIDSEHVRRLVLDDDLFRRGLLLSSRLPRIRSTVTSCPAACFLAEIALPGGEVIDPGAHGVEIAAHRRRREACDPAIVVERRHRLLDPLVRAFRAIEEHAVHGVVAVGEHIRLDDDGLADHALHREIFLQSTCGAMFSMTTRALLILATLI